MISVLITDDHPVVRQGIRQILEDDKNQRFGPVDEASNGAELLEKLGKYNYRAVILDISLPGRSGLELIGDIKLVKPSPSILMMSIYHEDQYAIRAFRLGASGYINKAIAADELVSAVLKVASGGKYITPSLAEKMSETLVMKEKESSYELLSSREIEVVKLLAEGKTLSEIASLLHISPKTISTYRQRIIEKLKLKSTADIIRYAFENKLAGHL